MDNIKRLQIRVTQIFSRAEGQNVTMEIRFLCLIALEKSIKPGWLDVSSPCRFQNDMIYAIDFVRKHNGSFEEQDY